MKKTADNNTEYELSFNGLDYWHRDGLTASALQGSFVNPTQALDAMRRYNVSFIQEVNLDVTDLESLEKKADLLGYAKNNNIEVPDKYKAPSAIKKFLQGGYK
jgi:hypothetical protein